MFKSGLFRSDAWIEDIVGVDPFDLEPLTPNNFLLGRADLMQPVEVDKGIRIDQRKGLEHARLLTNHFWRR